MQFLVWIAWVLALGYAIDTIYKYIKSNQITKYLKEAKEEFAKADSIEDMTNFAIKIYPLVLPALIIFIVYLVLGLPSF